MTASENERLKHTAYELQQVVRETAAVEAHLAALDEHRKRLERNVLPELFHEAGIKSLTLGDGSILTMSTLAEGSLPKDPLIRKEAIAWLVANGYGELIECKVTSSWARGDRAVAEAEALRLAALGNAKVAFDESINPKTLGARMRDRVIAGAETPLSLLGVAVFPRARFTKLVNNGE